MSTARRRRVARAKKENDYIINDSIFSFFFARLMLVIVKAVTSLSGGVRRFSEKLYLRHIVIIICLRAFNFSGPVFGRHD